MPIVQGTSERAVRTSRLLESVQLGLYLYAWNVQCIEQAAVCSSHLAWNWPLKLLHEAVKLVTARKRVHRIICKWRDLILSTWIICKWRDLILSTWIICKWRDLILSTWIISKWRDLILSTWITCKWRDLILSTCIMWMPSLVYHILVFRQNKSSLLVCVINLNMNF